jgi:hypothetical protein
MKTPAEAVARVLSLLGQGYPYVLGTGNRRGATRKRLKDGTWSKYGFDCWAVADSYAYDNPRTDPGFNAGPWATVTDDRNCDAAIEEAEHIGKHYQVIDTPELGCLIVMPSIRDKHGTRIRIGHVWHAVGVPEVWVPSRPRYDTIDTVQCQARTSPAIKRGPGPKGDGRTYQGLTDDAWRIRMLRVLG